MFRGDYLKEISRMRVLFLPLALLFFASASAVAKDANHPPQALPITEACQKHLDTLTNASDSFQYGWITVAQSQTNDRPVHLFYQMNLIRDEKQEIKKPVVFFNGGPSMDSHGSLIRLLQLPAFNSEASLILFDQRGTGCSSPYPSNPDTSDLNDYGSRKIVDDAESLREFLGLQKWTAFGQSYGGLIVQRYLETHPESLTRAVIHGMSLGSIDADAALRRFEMGVAGLDEYLAENPAVEIQLQAIHEQIPDDYCIRSRGFLQLCGKALMDLHVVFTRNLNQQAYRESFQGWVQHLFDIAITRGHGMNHPDVHSYWTQLSNYAIGQDLTRYYWEQVITKQEITPGFSDSETGRLFQADTTALVSEARLFRSFQYEDSSFLDVAVDAVSLDTVKTNLEAHPDLKFHIFAGELDVFSPASVIRAQYQEHLPLDNVIFMAFENSGHEGYSTESAVIQAVTQ